MRTYFLLAILGLVLTEALLLPRAVNDFRMMRKVRAERAPEEGLPATLSPFTGFDAGGHPVTLTTEQTRWILPVVVRSTGTAADLDYLIRLRKALSNREIALVGLCDANDCSAASPRTALPELTFVAYGSYAPLLDIARFDERDQLLLLNQYWGVKQALRRPPSPEELADEVRKVIAQ